MHSRGFLRNGRSRTAVAIIVIFFMVICVFSFHSTYKQLGEQTRSYESCQSEQQELLAQMKVVHDHKTRLEKSLEQEKLEHKKMREELMSRLEDEKGQWQREKLELQNQYSSLKQQYNFLKNMNEDLQSEFDQLTKNNNVLVEEKNQLEHAQQNAVSNLEADIQKYKDRISDLQDKQSTSDRQIQDLQQQSIRASETNNYLKNQNRDLLKEVNDLQAKLTLCQNGNTEQEAGEPKDIKVVNHEDKGVLPKPEEPFKEEKYKISSEGNPNPVAPIAAAPHVESEPDKNKQETVISKPGTSQDAKTPAKDNGQVQDTVGHYSFQKPVIRHPRKYPKPRPQNSVFLERPNGVYSPNQNPPQGFLPIPPGFDAAKYRGKGNPHNSIRKGEYAPIVSNWNRPIYPHAAHNQLDDSRKDQNVHQLEQPALGLGKRELNDGENHLEEFNKPDYDFEQEQGEEGDADEDERDNKIMHGNGYALDAPGNQQQFHEFRSNKRQGNGKNGFPYFEDSVMVQPK